MSVSVLCSLSLFIDPENHVYIVFLFIDPENHVYIVFFFVDPENHVYIVFFFVDPENHVCIVFLLIDQRTMCILYSSSLTAGIMCISSPFFSSLTEREKIKRNKSCTPPEAIQKAHRTIYENVGRHLPINTETVFGRPSFFLRQNNWTILEGKKKAGKVYEENVVASCL